MMCAVLSVRGPNDFLFFGGVKRNTQDILREDI